MLDKCYSGISEPELIDEPCGGVYTATDCIVQNTPIPFLSLPADSKLTKVIENMVLSLQSQLAQIQDLQNQINNL